jgi:hypothetical protein
MSFGIPGREFRWYLVHNGLQDGHAYFVGYAAATNELVGYLGKSGFVAVKPGKDEQFSLDRRRLVSVQYTWAVVSKTTSGRYDPATRTYESPNLPQGAVYLLSGDEVWFVDLRHRTADLRGRFAEAIDLELAPRSAEKTNVPGGLDEELMVRTRTEMIKINLQGEVLQRWALPEDARNKVLISWYDLGDDKSLVRFVRRAINRSLEEELIWLDAGGKIERRETVELLQGGLEPHEVWTISPALPVPVALTLAFCATASEVRGPEYSDKFAKTLALFWPALLAVYLVSALLAALAYRRQTRFALPGAGAWAAFVFLLGIPGWLAFRWHRKWPVLEACPSCHEPAPRDRETCVCCGELFPPPARIGVEIFE